MRITYDKQYKELVLEKAGFKAGKDGYLIDKEAHQPVKDINGDFIKLSQFSGFRKGSIEPVKSDLPSLIKLSKKLKAQN